MGALVATYGRGLTTLFLTLVALWIVGMIAAPILTMAERSFVHVDRGGALAQVSTEINRVSRDIATLDLDISIAQDAAERLDGTGDAPPAGAPPSLSSPPSPSGGGFLVPGMSVPSANPAAPPGAAPSPVPSVGGSAAAPSSLESVQAEIADLRQRRAALSERMGDLQARQADLRAERDAAPRYSLKNYSTISALHLDIFVKSLGYATLVTLIAFALCYPVAFFVTSLSGPVAATVMLLLLVVPYAINELLRVYAWVMILEREGVLNSVLSVLGLFGGEPPRWVASNNAVFLVMAYTFMLFMMFPLLTILGTLDRSQVEAARDLGASVLRVHWRVVLPHAKPGIAMGAILVFMLSAGVITVPELVGRGLHPDWFSQVIYRRFFESADWNQGSAYSLMLLGACIAFILLVLAAFRVSLKDIAK